MADDFGLFDTPHDNSGSAGEGKAPELVHGSAEEFLHEQLLPTYVRSVTGTSLWWLDHADHHMRVLLDPQGPFSTAT